MANCVKCGQPLREGAKFCGACGAKVEAERFCTQCGAQLLPGDAFCTQCGAAAEGTPTPKRRGRPPKSPAASAVPAPKAADSKKPDYPDVRGFYGTRKAISVSDSALVWSEFGKTYRLKRDWTLHSQNIQYLSVIQTKEAILALEQDYENDSQRSIVLVTLDMNLCELSRKVLCKYPAIGDLKEVDYYMTQFDLFLLQYTLVYDVAGVCIPADISLRQVDLASGEIREWKWDQLEYNGWTMDAGWIEAVDGEQVYLHVNLHKGADSNSAILIFDPHTGSFTALWQGDDPEAGCPLFYDWDKRIMWTHPSKAEQQSMNLSCDALVGRKIAPKAPILSALPVWQKFYSGSSFTYFDGKHAYYAPDYYTFFGYIESGAKSDDWNHSGHGRAETAMVWPQAGKIVMDLMADYSYTLYPLTVASPDYSELIHLRN